MSDRQASGPERDGKRDSHRKCSKNKKTRLSGRVE